ncbi:bacterial transcriptional activator domain-containing protein [Nonomuraea sp. NPDC049419]|uniref:AfsR/SARP family transcriptional regulator n=1 Tax=Nonomuraea sp. NPDC049419 TaxID=3155772 RepID=UPI00342400D4
MTVEVAGPVSLLRLLGPVEVREGRQRRPLGRPQEKCLIAALIAAEGGTLDLVEIRPWIWDDDDGDDDRADAVHKLASNVRRHLREAGIPVLLPCEGKAYRLEIDDGRVDVRLLENYTARAEELAADGHERQAAELLAPALEWCQGMPLTGLTGTRIETYRRALTEEVRRARLLVSAIDVRAGRHARQVGPLTTLLAEDPGNVRAAELLMFAHHRQGRVDLVQEVQQRVDAHLGEAAGTGSRRLRELGQRMFEADPALLRPEAVELPGAGRPRLTVLGAERVRERGDEQAGHPGTEGSAAVEEAAAGPRDQAGPREQDGTPEQENAEDRRGTRAGAPRDKVTNRGKRVSSYHADIMYFGERP